MNRPWRFLATFAALGGLAISAAGQGDDFTTTGQRTPAQIAEKLAPLLRTPGVKEIYVQKRVLAIEKYFTDHPDLHPTDAQIESLPAFYEHRMHLWQYQTEARSLLPAQPGPELAQHLKYWLDTYNKDEAAIGPIHGAINTATPKGWKPTSTPTPQGAVVTTVNPGSVGDAAVPVRHTAPPPNGSGDGTNNVSDDGSGQGSSEGSEGQGEGSLSPDAHFHGYMNGTFDLQGGRLSAAVSDFQKVLKDDPKDSDAMSGLSSAYFHEDRYDEAVKAAMATLELDPNDQNAIAVLHLSQGRIGGVSNGPADASKGSGASPSSSAGSAAAGSTAAAAVRASPAGPSAAALARLTGEQALKAAQDAMLEKDYAAALAFANRAIELYPKNPALFNLRSQIYAHQRDYARAEADARAGLALSPKDPELLHSLGFAQLREKDFKGALATANEMLELNPNDAYAYALRAHAYGSLDDRDAMMADLSRAAELDPLFQAAAARMAGQLQLPSDKDILFLFPGEEGEAAPAAAAAAPSSGRGRNLALVVGASVLAGLLLALALLNTVLAPLKDQVTSLFTRLTRRGPSVGPAVAEEAAPSGLIAGQYEISRQIGAGGMGLVFEGTDRSLGRRVAIKKMRAELRSDPREKARFVAEAKMVAALHHPNVVDIYAITEDGGDVFLIFEYVDGRTVHELVQSNGKLEPRQAARITRESAEALEFAHAHGVIHRDMKPSNVMLDASGRVKVMDFGIARAAKDAATRYSMTNTIAGTPPYMAPEQEQGHVRKESDVYALAVCAYEMLTANLPFAGTGGGILLNKINMSFTPPSRATAGLAPALDPVFDRAFQADPDRRYRTPKEFADALESALSPAVRAA